MKFTHSWMGACTRRISASRSAPRLFQHCHRPGKPCSLVHALPPEARQFHIKPLARRQTGPTWSSVPTHGRLGEAYGVPSAPSGRAPRLGVARHRPRDRTASRPRAAHLHDRHRPRRGDGCGSDDVRTVHQFALLRFLGCTSDAAETAAMVGGDERAYNAAMAPVVMGSAGRCWTTRAQRRSRTAPNAASPARRSGARRSKGGERSLSAHCEVAAMLAGRVGLEQPVVDALAHAYERWDGKGTRRTRRRRHPAGGTRRCRGEGRRSPTLSSPTHTSG